MFICHVGFYVFIFYVLKKHFLESQRKIRQLCGARSKEFRNAQKTISEMLLEKTNFRDKKMDVISASSSLLLQPIYIRNK